MKKIIFLGFSIIMSQISLSQNLGIGTTDPGSTLSVSGSISASYRSITSSSTLTASDYYVVYDGTSTATITLPVALAAGNGNFKGRIYKIKNNGPALLTIDGSASEKIDNEFLIILPPATTLEIISTGQTSGNTWSVVSGLPTDEIRAALESTGCASCAAYDAANTNGWVQITQSEYTALQSRLALTNYGASNALMATLPDPGMDFGNNTTFTQNFTTQTTLPGGSYFVALSFKTGYNAPANLTGIKFKLSNTAQTSGYVSTPSAALPTVSSPTSKTIYYFALKRSLIRAAVGAAASNMAMYQAQSYQVGCIYENSSNVFIGSGDISNPGNSSNRSMMFQVLATANRQW